MSRAMKDSGVEWIGEIPEGWKTPKLGHHYKVDSGYAFNSDDISNSSNSIPIIRMNNLKEGVLDLTNPNKVVMENKYEPFLLNEGDFLFGMSGSIDNYAVVSKQDLPCLLNQRVGRFSVKNTEDTHYPYIKYIFLNEGYSIELKLLAKGTAQLNVSAENVRSIRMPMPTLEEQQKIAAFLDDKTAQIDSIIDNTKQSIAEFKKYKQALITETVTKGLNPDVKMKDSGIQWLGVIPEHWGMNKVKAVFQIKKEIANKLGYDVLSITQKGLKIKDISSNEGQLSSDYSKYQLVNIDDFAMNHMDLLTGWVDCSKFEGVTSPDYRVFRAKDFTKVSNAYYRYVFQTCYSNKIFYGLGQGVSNLGRWRLPTDAFLNFYLPIPSLLEQQQIADYLDEKCAHIDSLIADKEKMVSEFEDYKKSLIYEYVTGKKEV